MRERREIISPRYDGDDVRDAGEYQLHWRSTRHVISADIYAKEGFDELALFLADAKYGRALRASRAISATDLFRWAITADRASGAAALCAIEAAAASCCATLLDARPKPRGNASIRRSTTYPHDYFLRRVKILLLVTLSSL